MSFRARLMSCDRIIAAGIAGYEHYELRARLRLLSSDCEGGWSDVMALLAIDPCESANYAAGPDIPMLFPRPPRKELSRCISLNTPMPVWFMIEALDREIARRPKLACAWAWRGALKRRLSDYAGAVSDLDRAERLGLCSSTLLTWRGEAKAQVLDFAGARADLARAVKRPCAAWNHAWRGRVLLNLCHDPEGLRHIERAIALAPNYGFYRAWRGLAKLQRGLKRGVSEDFKRAMTLDRDRKYHAEIRCWRGLAAMSDGRWRAALADFNRAIEEQPDFAVALKGKAQALRSLGRLEEWVVALDAAAHLRSKHIQAAQAMSEADMLSAARDLDSVVRKSPGLAPARRWRGFFLMRLGQIDRAREDLDRAVALDANDPWGWMWRGEISARMGNAREAIENFDRSLRLEPGNALALASRARARVALGKFPEALRDFDAAARQDPHCAAVFADRGGLKLLLRRPEQAAEDLAYAIGRDGGFANARVDLSVALRRMGDMRGSRRQLRLARALNGEGARRRLEAWERYAVK